jgi:hypothetical protein
MLARQVAVSPEPRAHPFCLSYFSIASQFFAPTSLGPHSSYPCLLSILDHRDTPPPLKKIFFLRQGLAL